MSQFPELYTFFKAKQARDSRRNAEEYGDRREKEHKETEQILSALEESGVPKESIETNGYWFKFEHLGYDVSFVNQTSRLCVTKNLIPADDEDKEMVGSIYGCDDHPITNQIRQAFKYETFIVTGMSFDGMVGDMMGRIFNPEIKK